MEENLELYCHTINYLAHKISSNLYELYKPLLDQYSLTTAQYQVLNFLERTKENTVSAIAKNLCMDAGNTSSLCKKMEKNGLVIRSRDKTDERVVFIFISPLGKEKVQKINRFFLKKLENSLWNTQSEDLSLLLKALEKLDEVTTWAVLKEKEDLC